MIGIKPYTYITSQADCQLYGVELTEHFFEEVYGATTSVHEITEYINKKWDIIQWDEKLLLFH